jgi:hypothetical protein
MALWVSFVKVRRMPAVLSEQKYKTIQSFRRAVKAEAAGSAAWARRKTGFGGFNDASLEVDVTAITGVVPALRNGGQKVS